VVPTLTGPTVGSGPATGRHYDDQSAGRYSGSHAACASSRLAVAAIMAHAIAVTPVPAPPQMFVFDE
jgi:hypothetical protein